MTTSSPGKEQIRLIDKAAITVVGLILLGFFLAFERFLAGSWRAVAAALLSVAVWFGGAFALDVGLRRSGRLAPGAPAPAWLLPVLPVLGAVAGAAYSLTAAGHLGRPVLVGAVAGGALALLNRRHLRRQRAATTPPAA